MKYNSKNKILLRFVWIGPENDIWSQITIHLLDTIFPQSYDSNEQFVIQRAENFSGRFFVGVFRLH